MRPTKYASEPPGNSSMASAAAAAASGPSSLSQASSSPPIYGATAAPPPLPPSSSGARAPSGPSGGHDSFGASKRQRWQQGQTSMMRRATTAGPSTGDREAALKSVVQSRVIDFFCVVEMSARHFWVRQRFPAVGPVAFPEALLLLCLREVFGDGRTRNPNDDLDDPAAAAAATASAAASSARPPPGALCSFVLPDAATGALMYCSAIQVLDAPQLICTVSRHPVMSFMETALDELASLCDRDVCSQVIIEPFVRSLIAEVPIPPPDRSMRLTWERAPVFKRRISICTPRMRHLPIVDDRCFLVLLSVFRPAQVVEIIEHLLAEDSIILHSIDASRLVPIAEALRALIFPFVWQSLYVPVLPRSEWHMLQSSSPFLVGVCCADKSDFQLRLHANCAYHRQTAKRFMIVDTDAGQLETVCRTPGLARRLTSSLSNLDDDDYDLDRETSSIPPLPTIPEPLRSNLLAQLGEIVPTALLSPCSSPRAVSPRIAPARHANASSGTSSAASQSAYSGSTAFSFPYSTGSAQSGSQGSAMSFSSEGSSSVIDDTADERVWIDHLRVAALEVFLTLFSHVKFHLVPLTPSAPQPDSSPVGDSASEPAQPRPSVSQIIEAATNSHRRRRGGGGGGGDPGPALFSGPGSSSSSQTSQSSAPPALAPQPVALPQRMSSSASTCSLSSLGSNGSASARGPVSKLGFDPVTFVADLPESYRPFMESFVDRRLFCDLISRQVSSSNVSLFDRLVSIWRKQSVRAIKGKMSPLARRLNDLLADLGFSVSATRLAIDRLIILSPEEMNNLFTSVSKVREALDHLGIPRFIIDEDTMPASPDNPRTLKLRNLMRRPKIREKPPLVCKIALDKFHRGVASTWAEHPGQAGRMAPLRRDLVLAHTVATLPHQPLRQHRAEARCAKLTALALMNALRHHEQEQQQQQERRQGDASACTQAGGGGGVTSDDDDLVLGLAGAPSSTAGASNPVSSAKSLGDMLRVVSSSTLSSLQESLGLGTDITGSSASRAGDLDVLDENSESSSRMRALRWRESQAQVASEDATDTLLSHIAASETVRRTETQRSRHRIDTLERVLSEKDQRIQELEDRLAAMRSVSAESLPSRPDEASVDKAGTDSSSMSVATSPDEAWQPDSPLLSRKSSSSLLIKRDDGSSHSGDEAAAFAALSRTRARRNSPLYPNLAARRRAVTMNVATATQSYLGLAPDQVPPRPNSAQQDLAVPDKSSPSEPI